MVGLLVVMIGLLLSGKVGTDIVLMGVLTGCIVLGLVEPTQALAGFSNQAVITVALLYVVAAGMKETGATAMLTNRLLGRPKSPLETQVRLLLPVAGVSAFVNNTPIVAMLLSTLGGVARRGNFPASRLFMPLSFASILGGVCTLIGTSTNIVVAGLLVENDTVTPAGEPIRFGMFTLTAVGLPIAAAGLAYMLIFGRILLPDRTDPKTAANHPKREYMVAMRVSDESPLVGRTIEQADLRSLRGLFLSRIDRADSTIVAVSPDEVLRAGDVLNFVGELDSVVDLQKRRGLIPITDEQGVAENRPNLILIETVVANTSGFIGRSIRDSGIRTRYDAVVVAVHRRGHRLTGKIGQIVLQAGDTLLLEANKDFMDRHSESRDFYLVTTRSTNATPRHDRAWVAIAILAALVLAISLGLVSTLVAALLAAGLMVVLRCCTGPQARANVDWQVLITIGAAFGVGAAMTQTGVAANIAHEIVGAAEPIGPRAVLASIYILTVVFTAVMTNIAAAVLMFPVALGVATETGLNPLPFAVVIAIAASCEFSTPIGYQTNLMVMGPGGYKWLDYTRFGGPLTILAAAITILLAPMVYGLG